jgi:hypothetical protein
MFEQQASSGDGGRYMQVHIEGTDMGAVLNNANYSALLGFVQVRTWIPLLTCDFLWGSSMAHRSLINKASSCRLESAEALLK